MLTGNFSGAVLKCSCVAFWVRKPRLGTGWLCIEFLETALPNRPAAIACAGIKHGHLKVLAAILDRFTATARIWITERNRHSSDAPLGTFNRRVL